MTAQIVNMRKTHIVLIALSAVLIVQASAEVTSIDKFFEDKVESVNTFFQSQLNRIKQVIKSSYVDLDSNKIESSVNNYLELETAKISREIDSYVASMKSSSSKISEAWLSFLPTEDPKSRLENPDLVLSVPSIIKRNGYDCEVHIVMSEGFMINIHRIPRAKNGGDTPGKTVILQHGLFSSSADWILNGPEKSLAYVLADNGYDVWIPNLRGNRYSEEHAWYKDNTKEYWNFSWHEYSKFDMPAIIDYILRIKGEGTQLAYIGHSMGTTTLFTMLSLRPEYNEKLCGGIALAPAVFMSNMKSPVKTLAVFSSEIARLSIKRGSYEILQSSFFDTMSARCGENLLRGVCNNVVFFIYGKDEEQLNSTLLPLFMTKGGSTSWRTALHMSQLMMSGTFQEFDYGSNEYNTWVYGTSTPPDYNLDNVSLNITLFQAQNDYMSDIIDVKKLHDRLPNTTQVYTVPYPKFNHVDYLWAIDAPRLINSKVLETLQYAFNKK